ncbi:MAG: B12-binding domain-containing radical SAM protein [Myxococcota bacterium]
MYDLIFIHTPKFNHYFRPLGRVGFINIIPAGLFSMANLLRTNGIKTKIIHIGVEKVVHQNISVEDIIKNNRAKVYGISLMWNHQAYECMEIARKIKSIYPESFILLGGLTASIYAEEILNLFDFIDGVIKGEGEIPLLLFMQKYLNGGTDFSDIPNLIYKMGNNIIMNKEFVFAGQDEFNAFKFTDITALNNYERYAKLKYVYDYKNPGLMDLLDMLSFWLSPIHYIVIGRGCAYNCSFCAGGYNLRNILGRNKPIMKQVDYILGDIETYYKLGIKNFTSAFYYDKEEKKFVEIFNELARYFTDISVNQDIWHNLPTEDFIDKFAKLNHRSTILLLVYSLSEKQRRLNSMGKYSNESLMQVIKYAVRHRVRMRLILSSGLPFWDQETVKETKSMIKEIGKVSRYILSFSIPTELSPWLSNASLP